MPPINPDINALEALITEEIQHPVSTAVERLVQDIADHDAVKAVLFYGSGLWKSEDEDTVYDFYVLIDSYMHYRKNPFLALGGTLVPPNVYYFQTAHEGKTRRCKFAVMTVRQFCDAAAGKSFTPHIWARFAQPCRLPYFSDAAIEAQLITAIAQAPITFHKFTIPLMPAGQASARDIWLKGLSTTYSCEIRSERKNRPELIFDALPAVFETRTALITNTDQPLEITRRTWPHISLRLRRPFMKLVIILRWIKAAFTFSGGIDYAQWKIERQSNVKIEVNDFQRKYPLIGGWGLFWKVIKAGGLK